MHALDTTNADVGTVGRTVRRTQAHASGQALLAGRTSSARMQEVARSPVGKVRTEAVNTKGIVTRKAKAVVAGLAGVTSPSSPTLVVTLAVVVLAKVVVAVANAILAVGRPRLAPSTPRTSDVVQAGIPAATTSVVRKVAIAASTAIALEVDKVEARNTVLQEVVKVVALVDDDTPKVAGKVT